MQRISRAPLLSATLSLDSCWIIPLPRLLHHVDQAPALGLGERPGLDHANHVALAGLIALVVGVELGRAADDLLVGAVTASDVDADGDRLVAFAGDDDALPDLGRVRLPLRWRRAGAGGAVGLCRGPLFAPQLGLALALSGPFGFALLRGGSARLPRSTRFPQPAALLPGKVILGVRLSGRCLCLSGRSSLSCLLRRSVGRVSRLGRSLLLGGLCRGW